MVSSLQAHQTLVKTEPKAMTKVESVSITTLLGLIFSNGCAPTASTRGSPVDQWPIESTFDTKVSCFLTIPRPSNLLTYPADTVAGL
jgi:methionine-rich copper-binding protein CopC